MHLICASAEWSSLVDAQETRIGGAEGDCTGNGDLADVTECGAAALLDQSRSAGVENVFPAEVPHGMQMPPTRPAHCNLMF
jgi:hypothetical protein